MYVSYIIFECFACNGDRDNFAIIFLLFELYWQYGYLSVVLFCFFLFCAFKTDGRTIKMVLFALR